MHHLQRLHSQAFLTGVLQNYARKYRVAVDKLSFAFSMLKATDASSVEKAPDDGCLVEGIFLEGCRWDAERGTLVSHAYITFPIIHSHKSLRATPQQLHTKECMAATGSQRIPRWKVCRSWPPLGCSSRYSFFLQAPSRPKVLFEELPVLWFLPQKDRLQESTSVYICPLYKVPSRKGTLSTTGHSTNYITSIELPCVDPPDVPIKAGVAAFLALQD